MAKSAPPDPDASMNNSARAICNDAALGGGGRVQPVPYQRKFLELFGASCSRSPPARRNTVKGPCNLPFL